MSNYGYVNHACWPHGWCARVSVLFATWLTERMVSQYGWFFLATEQRLATLKLCLEAKTCMSNFRSITLVVFKSMTDPCLVWGVSVTGQALNSLLTIYVPVPRPLSQPEFLCSDNQHYYLTCTYGIIQKPCWSISCYCEVCMPVSLPAVSEFMRCQALLIFHWNKQQFHVKTNLITWIILELSLLTPPKK